MNVQEENEKTIRSWHEYLEMLIEISVELGRRKMMVREILRLETGSVIKLSRSTGEGVDVRADNQSLMRGEIIVMEDHAGVRISEINPEIVI